MKKEFKLEKSLSKFLNITCKFSYEEIALLEKKLKRLDINKGDSILNRDEVCSSAYFIIRGSFYEYHLDEDYNIKVIDLYATDDWMLNHRSFTSRKPSQNAIEAFEDSIIYKLSIESIHQLIALSQSFLRLGKILDQSNTRLDFYDSDKSADEKYKYILTQKPLLIQKFPLGMIASYLKISPETLSRVRSRIT